MLLSPQLNMIPLQLSPVSCTPAAVCGLMTLTLIQNKISENKLVEQDKYIIFPPLYFSWTCLHLLFHCLSRTWCFFSIYLSLSLYIYIHTQRHAYMYVYIYICVRMWVYIYIHTEKRWENKNILMIEFNDKNVSIAPSGEQSSAVTSLLCFLLANVHVFASKWNWSSSSS